MTTKSIIPTIESFGGPAPAEVEDEPTRVVCPPRCKSTEDMDRHEAEVTEFGFIEVTHEVDFGEYAFGNVVQRLYGPTTESYITVNDVPSSESFTEAAAPRKFIADLMAAADWLESVQANEGASA